jgi:hypothetical protein
MSTSRWLWLFPVACAVLGSLASHLTFGAQPYICTQTSCTCNDNGTDCCQYTGQWYYCAVTTVGSCDTNTNWTCSGKWVRNSTCSGFLCYGGFNTTSNCDNVSMGFPIQGCSLPPP